MKKFEFFDMNRLQRSKIYLNLTNGLEFLKTKIAENPNIRFIRIQSSHIENKAYNLIFSHLDSDLLLNLALGECCIIADMGRENRPPKTIRVGIPIIKFVLSKLWLNKEPEPQNIYEKRIDNNFKMRVYKSLNRSVITKLKYFRKFLNTNEICLTGLWSQTNLNGKYDAYKKILDNYYRRTSAT